MKRKTATAHADDDGNVVLGITISHPEKVLWPKSGSSAPVTKLDLANYMASAAERILPHVERRPISIVRTPDGIHGATFFQRHAPKGTAVPMHEIKVRGTTRPYFGVDNAKGLVALAQLGVTEIHPWGSRANDPDSPERIIFDLDPAPDVAFSRVIAGAQLLRKKLTNLGFVPFVKTTGGKGLHVVVAIKPGASWDDAKTFAKSLAHEVEEKEPKLYTTALAKTARKGKIFIDYLRNDQAATGIAPWSPRARDGAPIAVPLNWAQLKPGLDPRKFTIESSALLLKKPDPWENLAKSATRLRS